MAHQLEHRPELSQNLTITPRLIQYLKVLQLSSAELAEHVEKEMRENPLLEYEPVMDPPSANTSAENSVRSGVHSTREDSFFSSTSTHRSFSPSDGQDARGRGEPSSYRAPYTLKDHLLAQLLELKLSPQQKGIARFLIESLNEDGYLEESPEEISRLLRLSTDSIRKGLQLLHTMDPPGVGARSLKECLMIQLKRKKLLDPETKQLLQEHLPQLARRQYVEIAKKTGIPVQKQKDLCHTIQSLNPRPGSSFRSHQAEQYVLPDLIAYQESGAWHAEFNRDTMPPLKINSEYRSLLKSPESDNNTKEYIRKNFLRATQLQKAIEQRKKTLLDIAGCLLRTQTDFLEHGPKGLKPLIMKTVAEELGISESTVSRAVDGKYIQTPRGTVALKYFFSTRHECLDEQGVSTASIQDTIRRLIAEEDKKKPLSDEQIKERLEALGITTARRTVAKYREALSILPAYMRKER